jgi:hypothetical protein
MNQNTIITFSNRLQLYSTALDLIGTLQLGTLRLQLYVHFRITPELVLFY